jgi:hypothetical protein
MLLKKIRPLFMVITAALVGLGVHKGLFWLWVPRVYEADFIYSLPLLYASFGVFSLVIVFLLQIVKEKSIDNVGFSYLLLTGIKMVVAYVFMLPILALHLAKTPTEKMSFFGVFIYFLAIETLVTIRILNNKQ